MVCVCVCVYMHETKKGLTVLLLGRSEGTPEPPSPGSVVPEWPHTWRPPKGGKGGNEVRRWLSHIQL